MRKFSNSNNDRIEELEKIVANNQKGSLTSNAVQVGLAMAGLGAVTAGVKRYLQLAEEKKKDEQQVVPAPSIRIYAKDSNDKSAFFEGPINTITKAFSSAARGDYARNWFEDPNMILPVLLTGGASLYGGYKLTDKTLNHLRKQKEQALIDRARREYEAALRGEVDDKTSAQRPKLAQAVDRIVNVIDDQQKSDRVKLADGPTTSRALGAAMAVYLSALAAAGGYGVWRGYKKHKDERESAQAALEKARRERLRTQLEFSPATVLLEGPNN